MCADDLPMDTRFVFIDPHWVATEAHALQKTELLKYNLYEAVKYFSEHSVMTPSERSTCSTDMPEYLRSTSTDVHNLLKGKKREKKDQGGQPKHDHQAFANSIAVACIQAASEQVGDFLLLSYNISKGIQMGQGAHMHVWTRRFAFAIKHEHWSKITAIMHTPDAVLNGRPDFMTAMLHYLVVEGLDGRAPTGLGCSRLYPTMGNVFRFVVPRHSIRSCNGDNVDLTRADWMLTSKHCGKGLLPDWETADPVRPPVLYNLGVAGVPYCYHTLEFPSKPTLNINIWGTFFREEDITDAPKGRKDDFKIMVDGEFAFVSNMNIPEFDNGLPLPTTEHLKKRRRRNIAHQRSGRFWTRDVNKA